MTAKASLLLLVFPFVVCLPRLSTAYEASISESGVLQVRNSSSDPWHPVCIRSTIKDVQAAFYSICNLTNASSNGTLPFVAFTRNWNTQDLTFFGNSYSFSQQIPAVAAGDCTVDYSRQTFQCPSSSLYPISLSAAASDCRLLQCLRLPEPDWEIRLVNATRDNGGRVEVRPNSTLPWGTFCGRVSPNVATTICRQIFPGANVIGIPIHTEDSRRFGTFSSGPMYASNLSCSGNVTSLNNCSTYTANSSNIKTFCTHHDDTHIHCLVKPTKITWEVQLRQYSENEFNKNAGWPMIRPSPALPWGRMCGKYSKETATMFCRSLGLPITTVLQWDAPGYFGPYYCPSGLGNLTLCNHLLGQPDEHCQHGNDQAIACSNAGPQTEWELKGAPATKLKGFQDSTFMPLFIRPVAHDYDEPWGTVSFARNKGTQWLMPAAETACLQLGFVDPFEASYELRATQFTGPIWIDNVRCTSESAALSKCTVLFAPTEANHSQDLWITCEQQQRLCPRNATNQTYNSTGEEQEESGETWFCGVLFIWCIVGIIGVLLFLIVLILCCCCLFGVCGGRRNQYIKS